MNDTLTLQHVSLLTLGGMVMPFLVVPNAVETNGVRTLLSYLGCSLTM